MNSKRRIAALPDQLFMLRARLFQRQIRIWDCLFQWQIWSSCHAKIPPWSSPDCFAEIGAFDQMSAIPQPTTRMREHKEHRVFFSPNGMRPAPACSRWSTSVPNADLERVLSARFRRSAEEQVNGSRSAFRIHHIFALVYNISSPQDHKLFISISAACLRPQAFCGRKILIRWETSKNVPEYASRYIWNQKGANKVGLNSSRLHYIVLLILLLKFSRV